MEVIIKKNKNCQNLGFTTIQFWVITFYKTYCKIEFYQLGISITKQYYKKHTLEVINIQLTKK